MATISIPFKIKAEDNTEYCDTLILEENHNLTDADIESLKQERFNNWLAIRNSTN